MRRTIRSKLSSRSRASLPIVRPMSLDQADALGADRGPHLGRAGDPLDQLLGLLAGQQPAPDLVDQLAVHRLEHRPLDRVALERPLHRLFDHRASAAPAPSPARPPRSRPRRRSPPRRRPRPLCRSRSPSRPSRPRGRRRRAGAPRAAAAPFGGRRSFVASESQSRAVFHASRVYVRIGTRSPGYHRRRHGHRARLQAPGRRAPPPRRQRPLTPPYRAPQSRSHGHSHGLVDPSIKRSRQGLRAVGLSLAVLGLTALVQVAIYARHRQRRPARRPDPQLRRCGDGDPARARLPAALGASRARRRPVRRLRDLRLRLRRRDRVGLAPRPPAARRPTSSPSPPPA